MSFYGKTVSEQFRLFWTDPGSERCFYPGLPRALGPWGGGWRRERKKWHTPRRMLNAKGKCVTRMVADLLASLGASFVACDVSLLQGIGIA